MKRRERAGGYQETAAGQKNNNNSNDKWILFWSLQSSSSSSSSSSESSLELPKSPALTRLPIVSLRLGTKETGVDGDFNPPDPLPLLWFVNEGYSMPRPVRGLVPDEDCIGVVSTANAEVEAEERRGLRFEESKISGTSTILESKSRRS